MGGLIILKLGPSGAELYSGFPQTPGHVPRAALITQSSLSADRCVLPTGLLFGFYCVHSVLTALEQIRGDGQEEGC